jgi:hypothetical protein
MAIWQSIQRAGWNSSSPGLLWGTVRVLLPLCNLDQDGTYHFCKDGEGAGICEKCIDEHLQTLGHAASTHEFVHYLRSSYNDVPEECVAMAKGRYISRVEWLENLLATWQVKPTTEVQA